MTQMDTEKKEGKSKSKLLYEDLTYQIIGAVMEVHKTLGCGFLEYVYEEALCHEFRLRNIRFERQKELDIHYKEYVIPRQYRPDLWVEEKVIVENNATAGLTEIDEAQILNHLKATGMRVGLVLNFGRPQLEYRRRIL